MVLVWPLTTGYNDKCNSEKLSGMPGPDNNLGDTNQQGDTHVWMHTYTQVSGFKW